MLKKSDGGRCDPTTKAHYAYVVKNVNPKWAAMGHPTSYVGKGSKKMFVNYWTSHSTWDGFEAEGWLERLLAGEPWPEWLGLKDVLKQAWDAGLQEDWYCEVFFESDDAQEALDAETRRGRRTGSDPDYFNRKDPNGKGFGGSDAGAYAAMATRSYLAKYNLEERRAMGEAGGKSASNKLSKPVEHLVLGWFPNVMELARMGMNTSSIYKSIEKEAGGWRFSDEDKSDTYNFDESRALVKMYRLMNQRRKSAGSQVGSEKARTVRSKAVIHPEHGFFPSTSEANRFLGRWRGDNGIRRSIKAPGGAWSWATEEEKAEHGPNYESPTWPKGSGGYSS